MACTQGQRAVQSGTRELIATSRTLDYSELTATGRASSWLAERPELKELEQSMKAYLQQAMPGGSLPQSCRVCPIASYCLIANQRHLPLCTCCKGFHRVQQHFLC